MLVKEETVKKRGWVKNAAIAFLAVMLVLTFFSNTIMNRALPEVAAQYAMSGTITARIRGSGTVSPNDSFEVTLNQTRTVNEVNVRLGHEVSIGDLLFTLAGAGSEELDDARDALDALLLTYERGVIEAGLDGNYDRENRNIQVARDALNEARDALNDIPYSAAEITAAQAAVHNALTEADFAEARVDYAEIAVESATTTRNTARDVRDDAQSARNTAQAAVTAAQGTVETRQAAVIAAQNALDGQAGANLTNIDRQIADKQFEIAITQNERAAAWEAHRDNYAQFVEDARAHFSFPADWSAREAIYLDAYAQWLRAQGGTAPNLLLLAYETITGIDNELIVLNTDLSRLQQDRQNILGGHSTDRNQLIRTLNEAQAALTTANTALANANSVLTNAQRVLTDAESILATAEAAFTHANVERTNAQRALTEIERVVTNAEAALTTQQGYRTAWQAANELVRTRQTTLENLVFDLSETQRADGITNALTALERRELRNQISRQREEITRLEEEDAGATVLSPVSGIVRQINISPGNMTQRDMPLAVIEIVDRGFTLSFPVTLEQSRRVAIGDSAEVSRGWWGGEEINAVLAGIRNDPQNPAASRILDFDLSGAVESGQQLNVTIGQRSENFEVIVPNSAIRSDTNGDFVLVVMSRNSPLGNRFIATRVDVIILASDDTSTAVTGGLSSWDFVITTSTRPIEPGMQIRLVDNP
ncbi:MAG: HlyD family efflux transporter periplasmic adaptor subunit [Oscillospiraceae bacterium]|nr:HlyD family efflux transporter periplasmic adaptor subunit [Oscillospiraceae bacterium]